jgi:hypothetical protein
MPALPAVPEVVSLDLVYTTSDDTGMQNRTFWQYAGGAPDVAQLTTFVAGVEAAWTTHLQAEFNGSVNLIAVRAIDLSSSIGAVYQDDVSFSGSRSGSQMPLNCCIVESFTVGRRYRGGHPRNYVPAFSSSDLDVDRNWYVASVVEFQAAWTAWVAAVGTSGWSGDLAQVNVSYYSGYTVITLPSGRSRNQPLVRVAPQVDAISGHITRRKIGSQRKRLGKPF